MPRGHKPLLQIDAGAILAANPEPRSRRIPLFLHAFVLGLLVAAPLGPVGATVIRTGLVRGFPPAFAVGMGAAVVDGVYFVGAAAGADAAFRTAWLGVPLWLAGTAFLVYLGLSGLTAGRAAGREAGAASGTFPLALGQGLLLTMTNPMTIASWLAVAGSLAVSEGDLLRLLAAAAFIATGTLSWFAFLSGAVAWGRRLARDAALRWASAAASVVILAFAVRFLWQGIDEYVL
jgi:threonine/homoserine/homoserine lactone efflux protein